MERLRDFTARLRIEEQFSVVKVLRARAVGSSLDGLELEACQEAARINGEDYNPERPIIPWPALRAKRDMGAQSDSAGGYLVGGDVASPVDILRPFSAVVRAGVTVLPGLTADTVLPRTSATSTVSWMSSETASATPSTPTFAASTMVPKIGIGVVQGTRHYIRQAFDAEILARRDLMRTAGVVADTALLAGVGTGGEPRGITNISGLSTQSGTSLAWSGVLHMKKLAADANAQDGTISFIGTPAVRELLEARECASGNGGFIWQGDRIASCPAYASTQMPSATLLSGPFGMAYLGLWGPGIAVDSNPFDQTLFKSGIVQWRVILACDVALACDAAAFTKASSIT